MADETYPTVEKIRAALLARADEFARLTGTSRSAIGKQAVNDPAFLSQVEDGRNFTIDIYERVMAWLDQNWPALQREAAS